MKEIIRYKMLELDVSLRQISTHLGRSSSYTGEVINGTKKSKKTMQLILNFLLLDESEIKRIGKYVEVKNVAIKKKEKPITSIEKRLSEYRLTGVGVFDNKEYNKYKKEFKKHYTMPSRNRPKTVLYVFSERRR